MAILACMAAVLLITTLRAAYDEGGYDFTTYLAASQALMHGQSPYGWERLPVVAGITLPDDRPYVYPLFFALACIPLCLLPYWLANLVWYCGSLLALFIAWCLPLGLLSEPLNRVRGTALAVPGLILFALLFSPIQNNLRNGQVNLMVLGCCVLFLYHFVRQRHWAAAFWLAAGIAIKLWPVVLLLFLIVRRHYRLAGCASLLALLFCLLPALVVYEKIGEFYWVYFDSFLRPALNGVSVLPGHTKLSFTLQSAVAHVSPALGAMTWLKMASIFFAVGAVLIVEAAAARAKAADRDFLAFSAYLIGALLLSPTAERHHLVLIMPACELVLLKWLFDGSGLSRSALILAALFLVCFLFLNCLPAGSPADFVALVLLLVLLGFVGRRGSARTKIIPTLIGNLAQAR